MKTYRAEHYPLRVKADEVGTLQCVCGVVLAIRQSYASVNGIVYGFGCRPCSTIQAPSPQEETNA